MRTPENMAEGNTSGPGQEGPPQGNQPPEAEQTPARSGGIFGGMRRVFGGGSELAAGQPPEDGDNPPAPPQEPPQPTGGNEGRDPRGIDVINTLYPKPISSQLSQEFEAAREGLQNQIREAEPPTATGGEGGSGSPQTPEGAQEPELSIAGLAPEDVDLFLANGYTREELEGAAAQLGPERFRQEAEARLQQLRGQPVQPVLTPEQIAQAQAEERAERIRQLDVERQELQNMPTDTPQERQLRDLRQARIDQELNSLGGGNGGTGAAEVGEGPPEPPDRNSLEFEASPERGREIAEGIIKWEALIKAGKLEEVNWKALDRLFLDQEIHIEAVRLVGLKAKIYEPGEYIPEILGNQLVDISNLKDADGNDYPPLQELFEAFRTRNIPDRAKFDEALNAYFKEANRIGLLADVNDVLTKAFNEVRLGINRKQNSTGIMPMVNQELRVALDSVAEYFDDRSLTDPEIARFVAGADPQTGRLIGVWDLYVQYAKGRFATAIANRDIDGVTQRPYLDNEFHLGQEEEDAPVETFWRLQHGWYIEIYAQTEEEFLIAAESYISRMEELTADPQKLMQESNQFVEVLIKSEGAKKLPSEFVNNLILGIEARVGVFGADNANERYLADHYKQFLDYINKDAKGPERWLALTRLFEGKVAAALWELDKDPRWEILFSLFGSRGQLAKASQAQRNSVGDQGLFAQVREIFIDELMGVSIRDKRNIIDGNGNSNLTTWMSDRKFVTMFDGLYSYGKVPKGRSHGDANIRAYEQFQNVDDRNLSPEQRRAKRLGRIQEELSGGKKLSDLNTSDQKFYKKARDEARKAFDIAFQMYGALGEKSKRAGGVFKTALKEDAEGKKYRYFVPIHYAEKFVQFAETWTKIKYADSSAKVRTAKVREARERAIAEFKKNGFEAKLYAEDGTLMMLKRPKEDSDGGVVKDANGKVVVEQVPVDFYIATHHSYGDWTGHTYWSYQEEDRHLVLSPATFAQARKIRNGEIRPEEADPWALQLLILDPTLRRVRRFEDSFEERERKLTAAAVEDSYQSHWRLSRELHEVFFPKYGTPTEEIGIYYGLRDYGGFRKIVQNIRARLSEDPERHARRGRRLIPYLHLPATAASDYLGQGSVGLIGVIRMFGVPVYREFGTLALDKFSAQSEIAGKMHEALTVAGKDEQGNLIEPLLLKLTNDSDELQEYFDKIPKGREWADPEDQHRFRVALRKSFGRLERYEKLFVTMETLIRKASGALWMEEVDVLTDDGELDKRTVREFDLLPDISSEELTREDLAKFVEAAEHIANLREEEFNNEFNKGNDTISGIDEGPMSFFTGSGRHSARIFHDKFFEIFMDIEKRGGYALYPTERFIYEHLNDPVIYFKPGERFDTAAAPQTIKDWLFEKFVPT